MTLGEIYRLSLAALLGSGASSRQASPVTESIRDAEAQAYAMSASAEHRRHAAQYGVDVPEELASTLRDYARRGQR